MILCVTIRTSCPSGLPTKKQLSPIVFPAVAKKYTILPPLLKIGMIFAVCNVAAPRNNRQVFDKQTF